MRLSTRSIVTKLMTLFPYTPPMEIFEGKHYTQDGVVYRCTRDSGTALSHALSDLVGLYVERVE